GLCAGFAPHRLRPKVLTTSATGFETKPRIRKQQLDNEFQPEAQVIEYERENSEALTFTI
ncbi:MAG: hypothetical protein AAF394_19940, partial [Planctomycetota bacterium]